MLWHNKKKLQKMFSDVSYEQQGMIGEQLNFAASEAYKLLRTNLAFSFPEDEQTKVVGITSSVKGEGKSLTAINLAYSIAATGKRVLLMECDMRLPTLAKRLNLKSKIGLSNFLVGMNSVNEVIQKGVLADSMDVISAGDVPPNAAELLGSGRMQITIERLSEYYDDILLDLPPVTVVSDALIASRLTSGMVVVVRQDYVDKPLLAETMRQLKHADAKVLGFVFNGTEESNSKYKKYYKSYYGYNKYGYGYAGSNREKTEASSIKVVETQASSVAPRLSEKQKGKK